MQIFSSNSLHVCWGKVNHSSDLCSSLSKVTPSIPGSIKWRFPSTVCWFHCSGPLWRSTLWMELMAEQSRYLLGWEAQEEEKVSGAPLGTWLPSNKLSFPHKAPLFKPHPPTSKNGPCWEPRCQHGVWEQGISDLNSRDIHLLNLARTCNPVLILYSSFLILWLGACCYLGVHGCSVYSPTLFLSF